MLTFTYLLLFLLEESDTVGEEFHVLLCPLSCDLGGYEFAVKSLIIIVLVNVEVHFLELLGVLACTGAPHFVLVYILGWALVIGEGLVSVGTTVGLGVSLVLHNG